MALVSGSLLGLAALGKLVGGVKTATAIGAAAKLGLAGKAAGTVAAGTGARMAGQGLANAAFKGGFGKALFGEMGKGQIAARLAPDIMFGGLAAATTPGDLGDKLIAGSASAVGGGLGGIALGRAAGRFGEGASLVADMAGSIGGDYAGMMVGDSLQRGKDKVMGGAGQTAYERMGSEQQKAIEEQIRQQTLASVGLLPGVRGQYLDGNVMNNGMV